MAYRCFIVESMQLEDIDVVGLQPLQGQLDVVEYVL